MNFAANEISKGKNLETNLKRFGTALLNTFNSYSLVRLSMNYYTYYEMITESANNDELKKLIDRFNKVICDGVIASASGEDKTKVASEITAIRNEIIGVMKGLTSLADIFNIYEYVLNRVEYRYKSAEHIVVKKDVDFADSLIAYIMSHNISIN